MLATSTLNKTTILDPSTLDTPTDQDVTTQSHCDYPSLGGTQRTNTTRQAQTNPHDVPGRPALLNLTRANQAQPTSFTRPWTTQTDTPSQSKADQTDYSSLDSS